MRALIQDYIDAYNRFDVDGMLACVHPEIQFKNVSNGVVTAEADGIEALRRMAEQSKTLFSERNQTVLAFESGNGQVAVSVAFRAVPVVDLPGGMKRGQELKLTGRTEFRFKAGKIRRITDIS
jgi:ketosteroid isomerase-like protein